MFDFYLIGSVALNIMLFIMWSKQNWFDLCIKALLLALSITGTLTIINTYNLIH